MQMIAANNAERSLLPLPAAALVIDMRGVSDDQVVERLSIEIADLASEMKTYNIHHWRYLTQFLSFTRIMPNVDKHEQPPSNGNTAQHGPLGRVHASPSWNSLFLEDDQVSNSASDMLFDSFEQKIDELTLEINRIRNNRIAAVKDLNAAGISGHSSDDATVRVIFLTDAARPESLSSAALYADRLKEDFRKLEHTMHQPLVNTTVLCLGHSGEVGPPAKLINGLQRHNNWNHLDSLILSEDYREDAALIAGTVQAYLAELLLYVLLIIPPFNVSSSAPMQQEAPTEGEIGLPPNTYLLGLAALEYSARWGKRWLNFGLAKEIADVLRQKPTDENKEKARLRSVTDSWFKDWRARVQRTIPDNVPGDIPALTGIRRARQAVDSPQNIFKTGKSGLNIGERTIRDLQDYQSRLAQTYVSSTSEPDLQSAVLQGTPEIMQALREREQKSPAERKVSDLGALQVEAEQILSHPKFFTDAAGAVPRARTQLWALGSIITHFQQDHQQDPLNPLSTKNEVQHRREALEASGNKMIDDLKKHLESWPFFSCTLRLKRAMAIMTLLLIMFLSVVTVFVGFAWLHHLIALRVASALPFVDAALLGAPTLEVVAWGIVLLLLIIELVVLGPLLLSKQRSPLSVEIAFWLTLLAFALYGWLVNLSIESLKNLLDDPTSIHYLAWLSFLPQWGFIVGIVALFILITELAYFFWWLQHLHRERERIVTELSTQHEQNIGEVIMFIADDVTLEIVQRAELTDGNQRLGRYYSRVARLCELLEEVAQKTLQQQQMAAHRLLLSQSETQQGTGTTANGGTWLNLHIRDEKLEMETLTEGYKDLKQQLVSGNEALKELAEFLLRLQGVETPVEIAQQFEEKLARGREEQRQLQLLMNALVATAMRFSIEPLSSNIDSVMQQYKSNDEYVRQHMPTLNALIHVLNNRVSQTILQAAIAGHVEDNQYSSPETHHSSIAVDALAMWGQLLWQNKHPRLDQALTQDGVLAQLARLSQRDYDPRAVMRHLLTRAVLFGRNPMKNRHTELYLLLAPSLRSYQFRQGLKLPRIIDFPDAERILLLGVQHYVAEPMLLPAPQAEPALIAAHGQPPDADAVPATNAAQAPNGNHPTQQASGSMSTLAPDAQDKDSTSVIP